MSETEAARPAVAHDESQTPGPSGEHDESLVSIVASKVLGDWLRNRQQLLVPLTLDLQKLEPRESEILMHAMVTAAHADGELDPGDRQRLDAAMRRLNAADGQRAAMNAMMDERKALGEVLAEVPDVETGAKVYAASLLATDRRKRVNRYYLRYLAERLKLPKDLSRSLEQRFNAGF